MYCCLNLLIHSIMIIFLKRMCAFFDVLSKVCLFYFTFFTLKNAYVSV